MHISNTNHLPGHDCYAMMGLVHGTSMVATHAVGDALASFKNFFGGKIGNYENLVRKARNEALQIVEQQAHDLGANAIIGLTVDIEMMVLDKGGFILAHAMGTAVMCQAKDMPSSVF